MNKSTLFFLFFSFFFISSCNSSNKSNENETVIEENIDARNIGKSKDLFPGLELPQSSHAINTTEENTISTESGTEIFVPDNAFVDKSGKAISAEVTIKYKEIKTPSDIIIEDIDMTFDSAGVSYSFQTAGMFELTAFTENEEVYLKNGKNIKVSYVSNRDGDYNFYHNNNGKWEYQGVSSDNMPLNVVDEQTAQSPLPLKPVKVDPKNDLIIDINTSHKHINGLSFYNKIIWKYVGKKSNDEIAELLSSKVYKPALNKSRGKYIFSFTSGKEKHELVVAPAFSPRAYKKAMNNYKEILANNVRQVKVKRNINVTKLGLMNYDRLYHRSDAIFVMADFVIKKEESEKEPIQGLPLFHITGEDDIVVRVKEKQKLYFTPAYSNKLIAIMPNKKVAIVNNQDFASFMESAKKGQNLTFELVELDVQINSPEDLNKVISSL